MTQTVYQKSYYIMVGKKKLGYGMNLDFYDLEDKDLNNLFLYLNQTVRYKGEWFVVKEKKMQFYDEEGRDKWAENWIKYPYKQPKPLIN